MLKAFSFNTVCEADSKRKGGAGNRKGEINGRSAETALSEGGFDGFNKGTSRVTFRGPGRS